MMTRWILCLSAVLSVGLAGCQYEPQGPADDDNPERRDTSEGDDTTAEDTGANGDADTGPLDSTDDTGADEFDADALDGGDADVRTCPDNCSANLSNVLSATCTDAGRCKIGCADGFKDCDGLVDNGCEYDIPSEDGIDPNRCDDTVYVSAATGDDDDSGLTPGESVETLNEGVDIASQTGRSRVLIGQEAPYPVESGSIELASGVSLQGGYEPSSNWRHASDGRSTLQPAVVPARKHQPILAADGLDEDVTVDRLRLEGPNAAPGTGTTMYGLWVVDSDDHLEIKETFIHPGDGGDGANGKPGGDGVDGGDGAESTRRQDGGRGGSSACGADGGVGGDAIPDSAGHGEDGADGRSPDGVRVGEGGDGGQNGSEQTDRDTNSGRDGDDGDSGDDGASGRAGTDELGSFDDDGLWQADTGVAPLAGDAGAGGGGGGAGGSFEREDGTLELGGGGGGGGAGGCGGETGENGAPGGGSFGVVVVGSDLRLDNVEIVMASGGDGGHGATGGAGGTGGAGASGRDGGDDSSSGGQGARGGNGGNGGDGAGGCGGSSIGLARADGGSVDGDPTIDNDNAAGGNPGRRAGAGERGCEGKELKRHVW